MSRDSPAPPDRVLDVTDPQPQDDLTAEADHLVQDTGNGLTPDDPAEQPSQDPTVLPEGTETGQA